VAGNEQNGAGRSREKKFREVDNVEDVENGGKKCSRLSLI